MKKYTKTELKKLELDKIRDIAKGLDIKVSPKSYKKNLIPKIIEKQKNIPHQATIFSEPISKKAYSNEEKPIINNYFIQINKNNLLGYI